MRGMRRSLRSCRYGLRGAPNVLVVLLDDVGFGASSAFGGPATPRGPRLAAGGLQYTRFHTTALCAPTRPAMLTGRNHHSVGMGKITELATSAPGNSSIRPNTRAPLAETLRLNGYSTAQFGKCHEVPVWQTSPMGPFDPWPTGGGFEYFYGFIGGETNQYYPALYEGTTPCRAGADAGGGVSLRRGHDRSGDRVGAPAEGAHAGQAVLRLLRPRCDPRCRTTCPLSGREVRGCSEAILPAAGAYRAGCYRPGLREGGIYCIVEKAQERKAGAEGRPQVQVQFSRREKHQVAARCSRSAYRFPAAGRQVPVMNSISLQLA